LALDSPLTYRVIEPEFFNDGFMHLGSTALPHAQPTSCHC
jgi:hypothetical protein